MLRVSKKVSVELLRHGPPHNQLLSPLTEYLALCDGHRAERVRLPFEHHDFLIQMQALRYQQDQPDRAARVAQVARDMASVLTQVPGLGATIGGDSSSGQLVDLELVLSSSELALLPFELADSPPGFASAGLPLALQTVLPVSIIRRNRRCLCVGARWPRRPKILVIVASPSGLPPVPALEHVTEIRRAVKHWVAPKPNRSDSVRPSAGPEGLDFDALNVSDLITVLEQATLRDVQDACSQDAFTHVHILAHGVGREEIGGRRFTLALHGPGGRQELVDGRQLAAALRPHAVDPTAGLSSPTVVTVASCDSGALGDVVLPGGSIVHDLHESGIPFVVGSQFPLSYPGSVLLVRGLYPRLLWGEDPRVILHDLRQKLSTLEGTHDWASVVAYAALPPDLDEQLLYARAKQAKHAADAALAWFDTPNCSRKEIATRLQYARKRLQAVIPSASDPRSCALATELCGLMATIHKREAEGHFKSETADDEQRAAKNLGNKRRNRRKPESQGAACEKLSRRVRECLLRARREYRKGLSLDRANHWHATQYLFLSAVLHCWEEQTCKDYMTIARVSATADADDGDTCRKAWGHATLIELALLEEWLDERSKQDNLAAERPRTRARSIRNHNESADGHARALVRLVGLDDFTTEATARQLGRYELWPEFRSVQASAKRLRAILEGS